jgi:serine/threonine-protein kinase
VDADRNLLFGALALQADLLNPDQFAEACTAWAVRKNITLAELLLERGWISSEDKAHIDYLLQRKLARHGDARASLASIDREDVQRVLGALDDPDLARSLSEISLSGSQVWPSTVNTPTASRDRYTLTHLHAQGGLGQVWLARDTNLGREVALKELKPERTQHPTVTARFLEEARITSQLQHPGIVPIYELVHRDGGWQPFYTMRFVKGRTLSDAIRDYHQKRVAKKATPLDRQALLRAFEGVCQAVAYAHSRGVLHRDLKGLNVVLGDYGEVIVLDWGLAKLVKPAEETNDASLVTSSAQGEVGGTVQGQVLGTPAYMPPEQASGRPDLVDQRSDVYGLGAILYEILTGWPPFTGSDLEDVLRRVRSEEPARPRQVCANVSRVLEAICLKALAKKPAERYATARELAEDVQRYLADEPVQAYREPLTDRVRRWGRRHRSVASAAAMLLVTGVVGLSAGLWAVGREQQKTRAALVRAQKAEQDTLEDYRASTDDAIEQLIGSRPELGPQEKAYLEKTLKRWQVFADRTEDDARSRAIRAEGQFRVARLRHELRQSKEAVAGYREALALYEKLAEEFPGVHVYRQHLAFAHHYLGAQLADQKQFAKAAEHDRKALAMRQKLADDFPAVPAYRQGLARTHNNLGTVLAGQNEREKAAEHYRQAIDIFQKLANVYPTEPAYPNDLAGIHINLGNLLADQNQREKAAEQYRKALNLQQKLVGEHPSVGVYRERLASSHHGLGNLHMAGGLEAKAAEQLQKALLIRRKLVEEFPALPHHRANLAGTYSLLGLLLQRQKQWAKAAEQYQKALDIRQKLADAMPALPGYRHELAKSYYDLGNLLASRDQPEKAVELYGKALAIQQKLAGDFPAVIVYRQELASSHNQLGSLLRNHNQSDRAAEQYRQELATRQKLADDFPAVPAYRQELANSHNTLGIFLAAQNQAKQAAVHFREGLAIREKLANDFPAVPGYRQELALSHNNLGIMLAGQNQPDKAAEQYRKAVAIQQGLIQAFPSMPAYQVDLGGSYCNYGQLLRGTGKPADSLPWFDRAIRTLTKVHQQSPQIVNSRLFLRNSHHGRAEAHDQLGKHSEAVNDWTRAIELSAPHEQPSLRLRRADSRVRAGQAAEAVAEVAELRKATTLTMEQWYDFACIYALASGKDATRKQEYADEAMRLLRQAVQAGFKNAAHMARDNDLGGLHGRDDFKKLLAEVEAAGRPTKTKKP